nr:MAG TPA: hypothetical protein [Microviridae sp.]
MWQTTKTNTKNKQKKPTKRDRKVSFYYGGHTTNKSR